MLIGTTNGNGVNWDNKSHTITIYRTSITITGARTKAEAIAICERNLVNFKAKREV